MILKTSARKKDADMLGRISQFQFMKLAKVPEFTKSGTYFKAELELLYKKLCYKNDCTSLDIYCFFEAIE